MHLRFFMRHKNTAQACLRFFVCYLFLQSATSALAQTETKSNADFTTYSLEELMNMELISAAKKPQTAYESTSAVFVITQEDIRRSGAVNLPEVLRLAPGIQVVRADPGTFAVTSRGFLGKFANKLLVLIDGRSIYSPLFSGTFWSYNDSMLENIERIEVIRGPGATLWGANAVNGVINIITKRAKDMQGGLGFAATGPQEGYDGLRYGVKLKENMYLTAYGKYMHFGDVINEQLEDRRQKSIGAQLDWNMSDSDKLFVSTQYYNGDESGSGSRPILIPPLVQAEVDNSAENSGGHFLSKWDHVFSPTSTMSLQLYYSNNFNRGKRSTDYLPARNADALKNDVSREDTYDLDFQHTFALGISNSIIWGLNARYTNLHKQDRNIFYILEKETVRQKQYSFFVQDEIALVPERLQLIVGSKFEYTSYTQLEVQPNVRLLYTPSETQSFWGSISKAARTPSALEEYGRLPSGFIRRGRLFPMSPPGLVELQGDTSFSSEDLIAYELGHRIQLAQNFSVDTALYYNFYDNLRTFEPSSLQLKQGYLFIPVRVENKMHGKTYGAEVAATLQVLPQWRLQTTYSHLRMNLTPDKDSQSTINEQDENMSPRNTFTLRSLYSITPSLEFDIGLYFMDRIDALNNPSHTDLTVRLGWKPFTHLMLEAIGYNLIDNKYKGFRDDIYARGQNEVRRAFYGRITVEF